MSSCSCSSNPTVPSVVGIKQQQYAKYDEKVAQEYIAKFSDYSEDLALRSYTSNLIGSSASLVLHGGGNTSVKSTAQTRMGDTVDVLCVKGSGYGLDSIIPKGFPQIELAHLEKMLKLETISDSAMTQEFKAHVVHPAPNPSVETLLHTVIKSKFVDHSHADAIVALADHDLEAAKKIFAKVFDGEMKFAVVPYVLPGFGLAAAANKVISENPDIDALVLLKHGLFTWGDTAKESYEKHIKAVNLAEKYIESCAHPSLTPRKLVQPSKLFTERVLGTVRGVFGELSNGKSWLAHLSCNPVVSAFAQSEEAAEWSQMGTITPDHVIRTKPKPLLIRGLEEAKFYTTETDLSLETPEGDKNLREFIKAQIEEYCNEYHAYFERNNAKVGGIKQELDRLPRVLLLEHFGLVTVDKSFKACCISKDIYEHTVPTILSSMAAGDGKFQPVNEEELFEVEYWSLEQAKLKLGVSSAPKPLAGKVAYITGGASGIGLACALNFASKGAIVCVTDILQERITSAEQELKQAGADGFMGLVVDVSDSKAVEESFSQIVHKFGGIDLLVSNAGVVVQAAPGMASCPNKDLELSMRINFYGHQYAASAAARRMVTQGTGGCLLFNVSKAPLNPGPKLGPYCIAKAATLALMRQYAVEYGSFGIRSNAVNADRVRTNLFDISLVEKRAAARGLTAAQYFQSNLLGSEVLSDDVSDAFLSLALAVKTTGGIFTVDGGNIAAAPR